jgi:hypothetical protein
MPVGTVAVDDNAVVTGSGASLELFNFIQTEQTAANPLPDPNNPDADWDGTAEEWRMLMLEHTVKVRRAWAREAIAHAKAVAGSISGAKPPAIASLTAHNIGGATIVEGDFGLYLSKTTDSSSQNMRGYDEPASGTYTFSVGFNPHADFNVGGSYLGIYLRAASGRLVSMGISYDNAVHGFRMSVDQWTSATVYSSSPLASTNAFGMPVRMFMRIQDDGSLHKFSWSMDGENYRQVLSQSRTAWLADGGIARGIFIRPYATFTGITAFSWDVTP